MQTGQSQRDAWRNARAVQIFETASVELKRLGLACYLGIDQPEPEAELEIVLRCASSAESLNLALVHAEVGIDYTNSAAGLTCVQGALAGQRVDAPLNSMYTTKAAAHRAIGDGAAYAKVVPLYAAPQPTGVTK